MPSLRLPLALVLLVALVGGCRNTANGIKADSKKALQKTGQGLEKAGEKVENAGRK